MKMTLSNERTSDDIDFKLLIHDYKILYYLLTDYRDQEESTSLDEMVNSSVVV